MSHTHNKRCILKSKIDQKKHNFDLRLENCLTVIIETLSSLITLWLSLGTLIAKKCSS